MKIMGAVSVVCAVIVIIACATTQKDAKSSENQVTQKSIAQWHTKALGLFNNVGFGKLMESAMVESIPLNNNQSIGKVTNPYGIRDDVLEFIIKTIPADNESAIYAAIRMMQYDVLIYRAKTDDEAVEYANQQAIPIHCLVSNLGGVNTSRLVDRIDEMDNITAESKKMAEVIRKKLAWKIIGTDKSNKELENICNNGDY